MNFLLDDTKLERLQLAAEDIAYLTGRGYARSEVEAFVSSHRKLAESELALIARVALSEPQYRARALKEMLPEDIARRPLVIDGHDVIDAVTTALAGGPLLETLDQTVQPLNPGGVPSETDAALERIGAVVREMRPSKTRWVLDESRAESAELKAKLLASAKRWKTPVEVSIVLDVKAVCSKAAAVATSDSALIEGARSWCNLAGPVVAKIPNVRRIKLQ